MLSCEAEKKPRWFTPLTTHFETHGRTEVFSAGAIGLIGPASSVQMTVWGDSAIVELQNKTDFNYVTIVVDGKNLGRYKVEGQGTTAIPLSFPDPQNKTHLLSVVKATEANTGTIIFKQIKCDSVESAPSASKKKRLEFIGNSITCGAAMDDSLMPCGVGDYKNYHNAYLSYGPVISRLLNTDYMLSSVSGFGVYRGWNTAPSEAINTVPEVYEKLYLDGNGSGMRDFSEFIPDVITICLGTNDLSQGDGIKQREPFDKDRFVKEYIRFIDKIYGYFPNTRIILTNSPMVSGGENLLLIECLERIKLNFKNGPQATPLSVFNYSQTFQNGCTSHPNVSDHASMASELAPFIETVLNSSPVD